MRGGGVNTTTTTTSTTTTNQQHQQHQHVPKNNYKALSVYKIKADTLAKRELIRETTT